jgi:predicted nucleic acid-binding protein
MIIPDTSIWIEFFKANEPYYSKIKDLIEKGQVFAVEPVFAELLQGARSKRERKLLLGYWENLPKYSDTNIFIDAGIISSENKWISKGVGLIDCTIVVIAKKSNSKIWTLDKKLKSILENSEKYN